MQATERPSQLATMTALSTSATAPPAPRDLAAARAGACAGPQPAIQEPRAAQGSWLRGASTGGPLAEAGGLHMLRDRASGWALSTTAWAKRSSHLRRTTPRNKRTSAGAAGSR